MQGVLQTDLEPCIKVPMLKKDLMAYYGTQQKAADEIGCTRQYISLWPDVVPELWAWKIQGITNGKLKVDRSLYEEEAA